MKRVLGCAVAVSVAFAAGGGVAGGGASIAAVRMTVRPAAEPQPALTYQLLPEVLDQTSGNAALLYYRMLGRIDGRKEGEQVAKWLEIPPADLPRREVNALLGKYAAILDEARRAARCEQCDWQLPVRAEGLNLILPSLSEFRHLSRIVAVQARVQIADGLLDQATRTLQTGFALARHQAEAPTVINGLVGAAIAELMAKQVRELVQARGAPNLYWALASLPRPLIDLRKGVQYESAGVFWGFPVLRDLAKRRMTLERWREVLSGLTKATGQQTPVDVLSTALAIKMYPEGKRYLAGRGRSREEIEKMPVVQVVATYAIESYLQVRDETFKWFALPYWQAHEGLRRARQAVAERRATLSGAPFTVLLPALGRAYFVSVRLDREIAALRCIEAVRLHAAGNGGALPAGLDDVRIVPIPVNPVTGKAFGYKVTGRTFQLDAAGPPGARGEDSQRYVVTVPAE